VSAKRKDAFSEAVVGVFMLAVLALLVYFTIVISGVDVLQGRRKVEARVAFTDVGGLKDHDSVMYRGTKVGAVERIDLTPSNLVVVIEVDNDVVLRETCRIAVCNLSMLGGNYLLLEEGEGEKLPLETTVFDGEKPTDWMRDVSRIAKNLNEFTSGGELKSIVTNIEAASEKIRIVAERVERGEGMAGKLLSSDETVYNDLKDTVSDVKSIVARLKNGEGSLGKLLSSDTKMYDDLAETLENANAISASLREGKGLAGRLLKDDDPIYSNLDAALASFKKACDSMDAKATIESANKLLENLNVTAERLKNGEGSVGKLLADDELYREVQGLTKDVRQVLDNFRDTTPISTFGSLIMGGL
jgi:phospholipid/cholesterol/gamma-HCH transport system substrate-binding protein